MSNDSKKQAASIKVGISNYVGSAALAVIAGAAALYTYISQTFEPPTTFDLAMVVAVVLLVAAIVCGGLGADNTANAVAGDYWSSSSSGPWFNVQALATLIGLVLVLVAAAIGANSQRRESSVEERVTQLERQVRHLGALGASNVGLRSERLWLGHLIATSDYRIDKLEAEAETGQAGSERTRPRLKVQKRIQEQECEALQNLLSREPSGESKTPPPSVCSAAN